MGHAKERNLIICLWYWGSVEAKLIDPNRIPAGSHLIVARCSSQNRVRYGYLGVGLQPSDLSTPLQFLISQSVFAGLVASPCYTQGSHCRPTKPPTGACRRQMQSDLCDWRLAVKFCICEIPSCEVLHTWDSVPLSCRALISTALMCVYIMPSKCWASCTAPLGDVLWNNNQRRYMSKIK